MSEHYILNAAGDAEPCDLMTWAKWLGTANRVLASDKRDGVHVSTVFLGLNHRYDNFGPPLIWETMIFGGPHDQYQDRYSTKAEALTGHEKACELAFGSTGTGVD